MPQRRLGRRGRRRAWSALAAGALLAALAVASPAHALEVGQKAPDFTLAAPGGKQVKLADLTAKGPVVLYTFIQAFTGP
jgi:peroxiredoxin Q/BCP